jgi:hypothetical protein
VATVSTMVRKKAFNALNCLFSNPTLRFHNASSKSLHGSLGTSPIPPGQNQKPRACPGHHQNRLNRVLDSFGRHGSYRVIRNSVSRLRRLNVLNLRPCERSNHKRLVNILRRDVKHLGWGCRSAQKR